MKQITLFFVVQIIWCLYFESNPQGDDERYSTHMNDTKGENSKNISVCEIHFSKHELIKSMYKIITSVSEEIT